MWNVEHGRSWFLATRQMLCVLCFCKLCVVLLAGFDDYHLSVHSDMATVAKAMACPDSGLEVRDRMWLKITIANAFIGQDTLFSA